MLVTFFSVLALLFIYLGWMGYLFYTCFRDANKDLDKLSSESFLNDMALVHRQAREKAVKEYNAGKEDKNPESKL